MKHLNSQSQDFLAALNLGPKSRSSMPMSDSEIEEARTPTKHGLSRSISAKTSTKKEQNFKVVVRVRPPLPREIDAHAGFTPVTQISKTNK